MKASKVKGWPVIFTISMLVLAVTIVCVSTITALATMMAVVTITAVFSLAWPLLEIAIVVELVSLALTGVLMIIKYHDKLQKTEALFKAQERSELQQSASGQAPADIPG